MLLTDLSDYYRGFLISHILYQELIAKQNVSFQKPMFWVRERPSSNAEVDLTYKYKNFLIPIEIKSGAVGALRSLHEFMDLCRCWCSFSLFFLERSILVACLLLGLDGRRNRNG